MGSNYKHTRRTACGLLAAGMCIMAAFPAAAAGIEATGLAAAIDKGGAIVDASAALSTSLASLRAENAQLLEDVAELHRCYAALTNMVRYIEGKCETDESWRRAYHQGVAAQTMATNELGIAYRVTIYGDGYVHADSPCVVPRPASPEDAKKAEAARRALIAEKAEAARQAMERASLPERVARILAERRAAAKPREVTVRVTE